MGPSDLVPLPVSLSQPWPQRWDLTLYDAADHPFFLPQQQASARSSQAENLVPESLLSVLSIVLNCLRKFYHSLRSHWGVVPSLVCRICASM